MTLLNRLTLLLTITSLGMGQSAWNTGNLSFNYQSFPFPAETLTYSGDLLTDEVPHQGVGGFEFSTGDTSLLTLVSYDLYASSGDTLADIFIILLQDSLAITEGTYTVNPVPGALKLFVWLKEVDPESLAGLLDASFTLDSLSSFDPSISVAGSFEIHTLDAYNLNMSFAGSMVNTSFQVVSVTEGSIEVWNSLPVSAYTEGEVQFAVGDESGSIEGSLNPLLEAEGAGALLTQRNDTLTYNFISYRELPGGLYDVFGVVLEGEENHFTLDGSESHFDVALLGESFPRAMPYMMRDVSIDEIVLMLESGEVPELDQLTQLYLPIGLGSLVFRYSAEGNAELGMNSILMANSNADVVTLAMSWVLTNNLILSVDAADTFTPDGPELVGNAFPNPFNSNTLIPLQLPESGLIHGQVYDLQGRFVMDLDFGYLGIGSHNLPLSLRNSNLDGGIYYFSLFSNQNSLGTGSFLYLK